MGVVCTAMPIFCIFSRSPCSEWVRTYIHERIGRSLLHMGAMCIKARQNFI